MLRFDDGAHTFAVTRPRPATVGLDFGTRMVLTSLVTVPNVPAIEASLAGGTPLFGNALVPSAIKFTASSVVLGKNEAQLKAGFEFGFVQGIQHFDIDVDYWGQRKSEGMTSLHIGMPAAFEVDTEPSIQPWSRVAQSRFTVARSTPVAGRPSGLTVSAEFEDHPLYNFNHTIRTAAGVPRFLRAISFKRAFRTIFCFRDKTTGVFEAISSAKWHIVYRHVVSYANNGADRTVTDGSQGSFFPTGGSPSGIGAEERQLMRAATEGSPLFTPATLQARVGPAGARTITEVETIDDFDPSFWR